MKYIFTTDKYDNRYIINIEVEPIHNVWSPKKTIDISLDLDQADLAIPSIETIFKELVDNTRLTIDERLSIIENISIFTTFLKGNLDRLTQSGKNQSDSFLFEDNENNQTISDDDVIDGIVDDNEVGKKQ